MDFYSGISSTWNFRCILSANVYNPYITDCGVGSIELGNAPACSRMPIRSHLNGQRFDPETIRVMGLAYELALISLRLFDRGDIANDVVAHKIIDRAKAGERDPERLCEAVLQQGRAPSHTLRRL